ncbi:MAG: bacteriohopanetetrol glucosamine biosynthesis glycosyltransferase HpnI [Thermoanaerobaculia bacterium]
MSGSWNLLTIVQGFLSAGFAASLAYVSFALYLVLSYRPRSAPGPKDPPPLTLAKPICGMEAELEENLRSWLIQDYPRYEVLFGVRDANDPALPTVRKVMAEFPAVDATLIVHEGAVSGTNRKVASLVSICRKAKYPILVVSDSDTRAEPDCLSSIASRYEDDAVGAVTCLTAALPVPGVPSTLGAMFINEEFLPSVLVSLALRPLTFCLGPTMSARKSSLDAIGGFEALTNHLADDYLLGNRISRRGQKVELASAVVRNVLFEPSLKALFLHELRWARTIRTVRPVGYSATVITMITPWALAVLLAFRFSLPGWLALGIALALRAAMQQAVRWKFRLPGPLAVWWIPFREFLSLSVYFASHMGQSVLWKRNRFRVSGDGRLHEEVGRS